MITSNEMNDVFYGFMIEDGDEFHSFAKPALMNAARDMVTENVGLISELMVPDIAVPIDYLTRMKSGMNYSSLDGMKKTYTAFFNKLASNPKLSDASVYFPMVPDTVHKINTKYLMMFVSEAKANVMHAIKDGPEKIKDLENILDADKIDKYKLQIAEVTRNGVPDPSAATELPEPLRIVVTKGSIKDTIIPYIEDANDSAKTINTTIGTVQNELRLANKTLGEFVDAVNVYVKDDSINIKLRTKVKAYSFTVVTVYRQLVSYLCSATILKMRYYMYNSTSLTNLYNGLTARNGEMVESVEVDKFDTFSDESKVNSMTHQGFAITKDIRSTIYDMAIHDMGDVKISDLSDVDFDNNTYSEAANVFKDIEAQLRSFTEAIEQGQIFITAREVAGLQNGFDYIYAGQITSIIDGAKKYYEQMKDQPKNAIRLSIAAEMDQSKDLLTAVSIVINHTMQYLAETKLGFEERRNSSYRTAVYEDCIEFFTTVREDLNYLTLKIANAFFDRYKYLLSMLYAISPYASEIPDDTEIEVESGYTDEALRHIAQEHAMYNAAECKNVMFAYRGALSMMTESVYLEFEPATFFTEADEQNQAAQTVKNNINANKPGIARLKEWITNLIQQFVDKAEELTGKNKSWLLKNEATLRGLTTGQPLTMYPFFSMKTSDISTHIQKATTNVKGIDVNQLYAKKPEELFDEIYGQVIVPTGKIKLPKTIEHRTNAAVVKQYYMVGTRTFQQIQYTPEQTLRNIGTMVDYCKQYSTFVNDLKSKLSNLANAVDNKINAGEALAKECGIEEIHDAYAFIMMEADNNNGQQNAAPAQNQPQTQTQNQNNTQNNNASGGKNAKAPSVTSVKVGNDTEDGVNGGGNASSHSIKTHLKQLSADYQAFSTGILAAAEYRYYAFMNALRGIIRANKTNTTNDNNQTQNNNEAQNQNNNEGGNA